MTPNLTAVIIFHGERHLAIPALDSYFAMLKRTREIGLKVEALALLDAPDDTTAEIVRSVATMFDAVEQVEYRDLGTTRNRGVSRARGEYLAFFDGDDLWGDAWLGEAMKKAEAAPTKNTVWHPEYLWYFNDADFLDRPSAISGRGKSFFMKQSRSADVPNLANVIRFENLWSANVLARRALYEKFPYKKSERRKGLGVEDWSWNIETVAAGVEHDIVEETVHLIRVKDTGSLGMQNATEGLLPFLPD